MKKRKVKGVLLLYALLTALAAAGCGKKPEVKPEETLAWPVNVQGEKNGVRLEDDYYGYVNHDILKETKIPEDSNSWSYFYKLDREAYQVLHEVLTEAVENRKEAKEGSLEQKIGDMYGSAMDMEGRRRAGFGELKAYMDRIQNASNIKEYLESIGTIYSDLGVGSLVTLQWFEDMRDSGKYALYTDGADLGPGKETLEDETQTALIKEYEAYIGRMMEFSGLSREEAALAAFGILGLQKDLAASALLLKERNNPEIIYNPYSIEMVKSLFPGGEMEGFLTSAGIGEASAIIVTQQEQMKKIGQYLNEDQLPLLKNYSVFCLIQDFAPYLTPEIRDNYLEWNRRQKGIKEKKTDEKLASEMVQGLLGFEFGRLYTEKTFTEEDKLAIEAMVHQILEAYRKQILALDWMGEETKAAAIRKLDHMTMKIGYPDQWPDDYGQAVVISPDEGGHLIDNTLSLVRAKRRIDREKVLKPVDKSEWQMTPQTVNAYYNPSGNEIVFPAAILQPPFYDPEADHASNLGGIGMVIAHEVSHAFDSSGSLYDEKGNYHVWWTEEDRARFKELADRVSAYYDGQDGYEGRRVNGAQTLNENIADLGSISSVTSIIGDDPDRLRLLFAQYATIWAAKYTPESMIQRLNTDVHAPAKVRVNAVLSATDAFYKAYPEIEEGDGMYLPPLKRVKIW
ncbi:MAG: M13 family metallopeptidase [Lacrimispora sp.]|uniref:M13 family metallopeptidase n=1 Tax=Lacrimispora sp. TaxID=2719234 RepID=UPI0039E26B70